MATTIKASIIINRPVDEVFAHMTEPHIAIATAANPVDAAPVSGAFRGQRAYSKLTSI